MKTTMTTEVRAGEGDRVISSTGAHESIDLHDNVAENKKDDVGACAECLCSIAGRLPSR